LINDLHAQTDSVSFKLPALKITQNEKNKNVVFAFEESENLLILKDTFLIADPK
jgi:hypothetical protein